MEGNRFEPDTKYLSSCKHYYHVQNDKRHGPVRMFVEIYPMLENNKFTPVLELYGDYCKYGDEVNRKLETKGFYNDLPDKLNKLNDSGSGWHHIANLGSTVNLKGVNLKVELESALSLFFGEWKDGKSFYTHV